MLILVFLVALLNFSSTAPVSWPVDDLDPPSSNPLINFERNLPISECILPERYRSLQGVIWSCVATIFACTWISMHPNVPDPHNSGWTNFRLRVRTFLYSLIGPEFVTIWALRQRLAAARHMEEYNTMHNLKYPRQGWFRKQWKSIKDWFCTPMGRQQQQQQSRPWTLTHGFLLEMHGLATVDKAGNPFNAIPTPITLNVMDGTRGRGPSLWALVDYYSDIRVGVIFKTSQLPDDFYISEEEINDKSKGDFFTKLIVVIQTTWFIVQCLARWASHLHVTELEVITLAFAFLNIVTYILWWNKPQNMNVAISVHIKKKMEDGEVENKAKEKGEEGDRNTSFLVRFRQFLCPDLSPWGHYRLRLQLTLWAFNILKSPLDPFIIMIGDIVDSHYLKTNKRASVMFFSSEKGIEQPRIAAAIVFIGILFGCIHLIPFWSSSFPSIWERYLWMTCAGCITVEPALLWVAQQMQSTRFFTWIERCLGLKVARLVYTFSLLPGSLGFLFYAITRAILIILAVSSLRALPPDAFFNVSWSTFLPHI